MERPSNDQYFLNIAKTVSERATCSRRSVGCVLTDKNHRIISTGYNSVPSGYPHCSHDGGDDKPCAGALDKSGNTSRCIAKHAEDIAIAKCSDIFSIYTCYITVSSCIACVRRLIDTSCERIVFSEEYTDKEAMVLWESYNRKWMKVND